MCQQAAHHCILKPVHFILARLPVPINRVVLTRQRQPQVCWRKAKKIREEISEEEPVCMEKLLFEALRFKLVRITQATDQGMRQRDVIRHPGSVVILPLLDDETVCLIRNYRIAVDETLIELPAGTLEAGEAPLATAHRELIEETGFQAGSMKSLGSFFAAPGCLDERMHLLLATELRAGQPHREVGEQIENLVVPWIDAVRMAMDGTIHDAKTMTGILLYDRLRER